MSNEFTRSHVGEGGSSLKDSAYQLKRCEIYRRDADEGGDVVDIRRLVGYVRIHESLFNPTLVFELGIRDDYNFLEEFNLKGDEIISLQFQTKVFDLDPVTHEYQMHVTKINDYARGDSQVHAYTLIGMSAHAYNAPLVKSNLVCNGITTSFIHKLCNGIGTDLVQKPDLVDTCSSRAHTVFGMRNPLQAALELLSVSYDEKETPYFLYQTLSNHIYLAPLSWMNDREENPVYRTFTYTDQLKSDPNTDLEYVERSSQIVKLSSNIGTSPIEQAKKGYGPTTLYEMNLNTKAKSRRRINTSPTPIIGSSFGYYNPNVSYKFTQPDSNDNPETLPPLSVLKAKHEERLKAQIVAYDTYSHQFSVMGDMLLNPGRTVRLQFPKTLDPSVNPTRDIFDEKLSGDYLIFQAVHTFQEGKHTTDVIAKTNS
jgi:hypothetical protein